MHRRTKERKNDYQSSIQEFEAGSCGDSAAATSWPQCRTNQTSCQSKICAVQSRYKACGESPRDLYCQSFRLQRREPVATVAMERSSCWNEEFRAHAIRS